jgi:hypothetical protein
MVKVMPLLPIAFSNESNPAQFKVMQSTSSDAIHSLAHMKLATGMRVIAISIAALSVEQESAIFPHSGLPVNAGYFMINFCNGPHIRAAGHNHRNGACGVRGG